MSKALTIHIVDDDDAARDSLSALLSVHGHPLRCFSSGQDFLDALEPGWKGCLILDVRMPGLSGPQVQEKLADREHNLPVIIVTGHGDLPVAVKAMKAGAIDFIEKPYDEDVMLESIKNALALSEEKDIEQGAAEDLSSRVDQLTPREREVMVQVAMGHPNKVVAYELGISPRTVEIHRARVVEKMNARNLSHLVRLAIQANLIPEGV